MTKSRRTGLLGFRDSERPFASLFASPFEQRLAAWNFP